MPEPFASQLHHYLYNRPNQRTTGGAVGTPWLFPSNRPGRHIDPQSIMMRLRWLGINLLGSRNTALRELVSAIPPPVVAQMLGYSDTVTQKHAADAGNTWGRYASTAPDRTIAPTTPTGHAMATHEPDERRPDDTDEPDNNSHGSALFDLDPPVRPYDIHLESLGAAATALNEAHNAVQAAEEQLAQVMLQARHAGLSSTKIAATLGISRQTAYQRWAVRLRAIDDLATPSCKADNQPEIPFDE